MGNRKSKWEAFKQNPLEVRTKKQNEIKYGLDTRKTNKKQEVEMRKCITSEKKIELKF